jgi:hypothetical protein
MVISDILGAEAPVHSPTNTQGPAGGSLTDRI